MFKIKQQYRGENISQHCERNPLRNICSLQWILKICVMIWWFQSHALYCPSVIYPPDIHCLINVMSDLLNLFSFILTAFPLDRPDAVCVDVCVCKCKCEWVSAVFSLGKKQIP